MKLHVSTGQKPNTQKCLDLLSWVLSSQRSQTIAIKFISIVVFRDVKLNPWIWLECQYQCFIKFNKIKTEDIGAPSSLLEGKINDS